MQSTTGSAANETPSARNGFSTAPHPTYFDENAHRTTEQSRTAIGPLPEGDERTRGRILEDEIQRQFRGESETDVEDLETSLQQLRLFRETGDAIPRVAVLRPGLEHFAPPQPPRPSRLRPDLSKITASIH
jgi:hypothetical protein